MRISDWGSDVCSSDLRIDSARRDAGQAGHVGLLAVSKTQSADAIRALASAGQRAFGENYVQEAASKQDALRELTIEWHRSEEHTSELQSLMRISYAVFCLKKKNKNHQCYTIHTTCTHTNTTVILNTT